MNGERKEIIQDSFCNVLEQVAFMFGETCSKDEIPDDKKSYVQAKMTYSGDFPGHASITVPIDMCPVIAANILGVIEDDEQAFNLATDSLKEVLNISCGLCLTSIAGETKLFDLSVPQINELDQSSWKTIIASEASIGLIVDDFPVLVEFVAENGE